MAQKDDAVIVAAVGYLFTNTPGATSPTPSELADIDPLTFGAQVQEIKLTSGTATGGTYSVNGVGDTPVDVDWDATAAEVQAALESLDSIGVGNVTVTGTALSSGYLAKFIGTLQGVSLTALVLDDTDLTGTLPVLPASATVSTAASWSTVGHTSRDDMPEFGFDGGDTKVTGTWQKKRLREIATGDPVADFVTVKLEQWDRNTLELYFGADSASTAGVFGVSGEFTPVEKALLMLIVDGDETIGFYAAKASWKRDDSINLPVDDLSSLPVKATFLNLGTHRLYDWISEDLF